MNENGANGTSRRSAAKTDVLFTHSWHLLNDPKQAQRQQPYPPLGTLYAAALARESGFSVAVFDSTLEDPQTGIEAALDRHQPRLVVICEDSFNFLSKMCLSMAREVSFAIEAKARERRIPVVVHGSDSTDNAEEYLRRGFLAVLKGECESTIMELLQAYLENGQQCSWQIPGMVYLGARGELISTGTRRPSIDLDRYPFPARDLIAMESYAAIWRDRHGRASTNIIASRGCPFRCNWCAKPVFGNKFALRSPDSVAAEVRALKFGYGISHLWFADDVFALDRHWVKEFAECVQRRHAVLPFKIQSRADLMTEETVNALRAAGCEEVWMGAESGAQAILDAMDKGLSVNSIVQARERLGRAGIRAAFFLQFGYPGESLPEIEETIALVRRCRPDDIGISVSYPLPGTVFHQRVREQLGAKQHWHDSDDLSAMFRAAYTDQFYRALRNALHAEVDQYTAHPDREATERLKALWGEVYRMEKHCRNAFPTELPVLRSHAGDEMGACATEPAAPMGDAPLPCAKEAEWTCC
jgi:anaerobic magnesium-protoporphyrin IX monomethyl ester cyclase